MYISSWSKFTFPWNYNSSTLSCYKAIALTSSYSNGELVSKLLNDLLQIKMAVQCCLQDTLSCSSHQCAKQNFKYLELAQTILLLQRKFLSVLCRATYKLHHSTRQCRGNCRNAVLGKWQFHHRTVLKLFKALCITRIFHMEGNQEHGKLDSTIHPLL